jgi:hypothetical protein
MMTSKIVPLAVTLPPPARTTKGLVSWATSKRARPRSRRSARRWLSNTVETTLSASRVTVEPSSSLKLRRTLPTVESRWPSGAAAGSTEAISGGSTKRPQEGVLSDPSTEPNDHQETGQQRKSAPARTCRRAIIVIAVGRRIRRFGQKFPEGKNLPGAIIGAKMDGPEGEPGVKIRAILFSVRAAHAREPEGGLFEQLILPGRIARYLIFTHRC